MQFWSIMIHSVTNLKLFGILDGHIENENPLNMNIENQLINNDIKKYKVIINYININGITV